MTSAIPDGSWSDRKELIQSWVAEVGLGNGEMSDRILHFAARAALGALLLCLAQVPSAGGDFGSCIANASAYVAELDELLSREKNWITPYNDLNERYFPFRNCEADALLEVVKRSRFIRSIDYHPPTNQYLIYFSSNHVEVEFNYLASEKRSNFKSAFRVHK